MTLETTPFELAAAGLLHDVGKVLQPAGVDLCIEARMIEQMICPVFEGRYSHRHVLFTAHAFAQARSNFGQMNRSHIERIANYHHRPSDRLDELILTKADWLASGHDREPSRTEADITGLASIIARLNWPRSVDLTEQLDALTVPTAELNFAEIRYLPHTRASSEDYRQRCGTLSKRILEALDTNFHSPQSCCDGLLGWTQRLFHAIPASRYRGHIPDVSLFDHSRAVAAIAACLGMLDHSDARSPNEIQGKYRFVTLGIGSIQRFIFHSVPSLEPSSEGDRQRDTKGSAKRLRARSFYIALASWLAARKLLKSIGLPPTNLVYDAGGHALLLVPDCDDVVTRLAQELDVLSCHIRDDFGGILRFDHAISPPLKDHHFNRDHFQQVFRDLEAERANARYRAPDSRLRNGAKWADDGWVRRDGVSLPIDRDDFLDQMRTLGNALPRARYLAIGDSSLGLWRGTLLGETISLHVDRPAAGDVFALTLDEEDLAVPVFLSGSHLPVSTPATIQRLQKSTQQQESSITKEGETLTFGDLAQLAVDDGNLPVTHAMLAALKADIDLLGGLMSYGFNDSSESEDQNTSEASRATLGRLASLSRQLDQFFKGFLTEQIRNRNPHLYTVFVGGDDLFLIGPWYDLVRFTRDLHGWFHRMTCGNPNVTFSAGLVFAKSTTPVRHLAEVAEQSLDAAKEAGRNRISYGNVTLRWEQYLAAMELHQLLLKCSRSDSGERTINTSLTYRLLQYAKQAMRIGSADATSNARQPLQFADMKWRAQLSYDLKRNFPKPPDSNSPLALLLQELMKIQSPVDDAPVLYTAASLTLYLLRGEEK